MTTLEKIELENMMNMLLSLTHEKALKNETYKTYLGEKKYKDYYKEILDYCKEKGINQSYHKETK